jgi:hypothetical protein
MGIETFSMRWQVAHSKVRCSKPGLATKIPTNPILCLQVGQDGRSTMEDILRINLLVFNPSSSHFRSTSSTVPTGSSAASPYAAARIYCGLELSICAPWRTIVNIGHARLVVHAAAGLSAFLASCLPTKSLRMNGAKQLVALACPQPLNVSPSGVCGPTRHPPISVSGEGQRLR